MSLHKDLNNNIHDDMDGTALSYLPEGCIAITQEEADAIVSSKVVPPTYQQLRAAAYPPLAEQIGAIWKGGEAAEIMKAAIQAVKDSIPKT